MSGTALGEPLARPGPGSRARPAARRPRAARPLAEPPAGVAAGGGDGRRLPDAGAVEPRPRGGQLSQRPLLPRRLLAVGQLLVRGPPPARLLAARARRSARSSARACWWRSPPSPQALIFERLLAREAPGTAGRVASLWFAFGAGFALLSSRVPYDLGLALGLAALAARAARARGRRSCCACCARWRARWRERSSRWRCWRGRSRARRRRLALGMMLAALVPILALAVLFPEGGTQPFVASAFWAPLAAVLLLALLAGREQRAAAHRPAAVRAAAGRGLRGAERGGRQRRAPRGAARGARGGADPAAWRGRALRPRAAVAARRAGAADALLADQRAAGGLPRGPRTTPR